MGLTKWIARIGAVGGTARWAAQVYHALRAQYPDKSAVSDPEIFHAIANSRMSAFPDTEASVFLSGWLKGKTIGLKHLVVGIIIAEKSRNDPFSFPSACREVIEEELVKARIPKNVIELPE